MNIQKRKRMNMQKRNRMNVQKRKRMNMQKEKKDEYAGFAASRVHSWKRHRFPLKLQSLPPHHHPPPNPTPPHLDAIIIMKALAMQVALRYQWGVQFTLQYGKTSAFGEGQGRLGGLGGGGGDEQVGGCFQRRSPTVVGILKSWLNNWALCVN